jgi:hypothetical protein
MQDALQRVSPRDLCCAAAHSVTKFGLGQKAQQGVGHS